MIPEMERPYTPRSPGGASEGEEGPGVYKQLLTPTTSMRDRKTSHRLLKQEDSPSSHEISPPKLRTRLHPSTADSRLRLSTASLGAVKRLSTSSSIATGDSFHSALGSWNSGHKHRERRLGLPMEEEYNERNDSYACDGLGTNIVILEDLVSDRIISARQRSVSVDTTNYEPSSAASSPQHKQDHSYHFSSPLSPPPPRYMGFQRSENSSGASSLSTSPSKIPIIRPSFVDLPALTESSRASKASSTTTLPHQSRVRYCSYTSLHTGIRCNAPAYEMQYVCPIHLHRGSSPSTWNNSMERRKKKTQSENIGQRWPQDLFHGEVAKERPVYSPYDLSTGENVVPESIDSYENHISSPFKNSRVSAESRSRHQSLYACSLPSATTNTATAGINSLGGLRSPVQLTPDTVPMMGNTVIDWKSNESRRKEYEEADRRKRGMWNWVRRRIMGLCCVKEQADFWEGDSASGDGGSVRRYRLVLPEEKDEKEEEEQSAAVTPKANTTYIPRIVRRASLSDVSWKWAFGGREKDYKGTGMGGVRILERVVSNNTDEIRGPHGAPYSLPASPPSPPLRSQVGSRAQSEDGRTYRNRIYSSSDRWLMGGTYANRRVTRQS